MSLSTPILHEAVTSLCLMKGGEAQCKAAHKMFFGYADQIAKESGKPTPFNRKLKVLGFHLATPKVNPTTGTAEIVKCSNHGCAGLGMFEMEELYIINGSNGGTFRLRVAKTSGGAIASFTIMMVVLLILIVLLIVWGVKSSKKKSSHPQLETQTNEIISPSKALFW